MDYRRLGNLYELLGVSQNADEEIIRAAWKVQAVRVHPDRKGGSHDLAAKVNMAKDILLDRKRRAEYDEAFGKLIGNYRIVRQIGEGAFGRTYEAEHILLGEKACLKQNINITAEESEIMSREAKVLWRLHHYSLPTLRDYFRHADGSVIIAMSFVEGKNLEKIVEKHKGIEAEHACWIMQRLLNAMNYLHYNGVIHGDIKPQNIIVQPDEHNAVLVDYGFSSVRPTRHSAAEGYTPAYVAPELLMGKPPVPESDLYSLGGTMIYALGGDPMAKTYPKGVPGELRAFIDRLVLHAPDARPSWEKEDLVKALSDIRQKVFGRRASGKKLEI